MVWCYWFVMLIGTLHAQSNYNSGLVSSIETFSEIGGRVDWHKGTNQILYDQQLESSCDIILCDSAGNNQLNLTEDMTGRKIDGQWIRKWHHRGQPAWHPDGDYIVFQVMNEYVSARSATSELLSLGVNNDLWVMRADGSGKQKLTDNPEGYAVLHAHFSHDGQLICWAEKYNDNKRSSKFGSWRIKLARFVADTSGVRLEDVKSLEPVQGKWYETHGFGLNDSSVIFSGNLTTDHKANDLYEYNWYSNTLTNLTNSSSTWEEMYNVNPSDSNEYSFISSKFFDWNNRFGWATLRTELYINRNGKWHQLTSYNQEDGIGGTQLTKKHYFIGDHCYSADGNYILAVLAEAAIGRATSKIIKIHLR